MSVSPSDYSSKHIASTFVRRHNAVRYHKGSRADMVSNYTDRDIILLVFLIFLSCYFANLISKSQKSIHIKDGIYILYSYSKSLKSHTSIDILLFKLCIMSLTIIIKL